MTKNKEKYVLEHKSRYEELSLISCGYEDCLATQVVGPLVRDYYILHFVLSGEGYYYVNNRYFKVQENQCFLIEPDFSTLYQANPKNPWTYTWICFNGTKAAEIVKRLNISSISPIASLTKEAVEKIYKMISDIVCHQELTLANEYYIQGCLYFILAEIVFAMQANYDDLDKNDNGYIDKAVSYIIKSEFRNLDVYHLAKHLSISYNYLYKLFQSKLNTSPQQFILNMKMSKARELLAKSDLSIESISYACGYKNPFAFSRAFKNSNTVSPRDYRKLCKKDVHNI